VSRRPIHQCVLAFFLLALVTATQARAGPDDWRHEWPHTDFSRHSVAYDEIFSGGSSKDGIPAIDRPKFIPVSEVKDLAAHEPVISVEIGGEARAYPLRIMIWHEIVNDRVGGTPIVVTWCPPLQFLDRVRPTRCGQDSEFRHDGQIAQLRPRDVRS